MIAPVLQYGVSAAHMHFAGTLTVSRHTFATMVDEVLGSMLAHGFRKIFILSGHGGNNDVPGSGCPQQENGQYQVGSGGMGGAIYADGGDPHVLRVCGSHLARNQGSSLGGAVFRVGYDEPGQGLEIDRSTFEDNLCEGTTPEGVDEGGAGGVYAQQQPVSVRASTFARNHARGAGGGLRLESAAATVENCTFFGNSLTRGIGAAIFWGGSSTGTITTAPSPRTWPTAAAAFSPAPSPTPAALRSPDCPSPTPSSPTTVVPILSTACSASAR